MPQVRSTMVDDLDDAPPGAFVLLANELTKIVGMQVRCPCGCGDTFTVPFADRGKMDWNRRPGAVTLTSSVQAHVRDSDGDVVLHYGGVLVDGIWHELN